MLDFLKIRWAQGRPYIKSLREVRLKKFRGLPQIRNVSCENSCTSCMSVCPTEAITLSPLTIDLGRCIFCDECSLACPVGKIQYTPETQMATHNREDLFIRENPESSEVTRLAVKSTKAIKQVFGRSLRLRSVSAGGCNACELEISAMNNVNFDIGRFGIEFVASPRHADGLVLSGPITKNMSEALTQTYEGMPDPKIILAVGACGISGGLFRTSEEVDRKFLVKFQPHLYIPGCPPHPLTLIKGILDFIGRSLP